MPPFRQGIDLVDQQDVPMPDDESEVDHELLAQLKDRAEIGGAIRLASRKIVGKFNAAYLGIEHDHVASSPLVDCATALVFPDKETPYYLSALQSRLKVQLGQIGQSMGSRANLLIVKMDQEQFDTLSIPWLLAQTTQFTATGSIAIFYIPEEAECDEGTLSNAVDVKKVMLGGHMCLRLIFKKGNKLDLSRERGRPRSSSLHR